MFKGKALFNGNCKKLSLLSVTISVLLNDIHTRGISKVVPAATIIKNCSNSLLHEAHACQSLPKYSFSVKCISMCVIRM